MSNRIRVVLLALFGAFGVVSCSTPDSDERVRRGNEYFEQGKISEAVIEYRAAVQAAPNRGDVRLKLGDAYARQARPAEARAEYIRAADLRPSDVVAHIKAGLALLRAGNLEDAKSWAQKAVAIDPNNPEAQVLLGNAMAGLQDMEGALAEYQKAIALSPSQEAAYTNTGVVQFIRGETAAAEAAFRKAVEVAPASVEARLALVHFLWTANRLAEAEEILRQSVAQHPRNIQVHRAVAMFYLAAGRPAEAESSFIALEKAINSPDASLAVADYYVSLRRFDDATRILRGLTSRENSYAAASLRLAAIDVANGSRAQAIEKLRALLEKVPDDVWARLMLARLRFLDGHRDEALKQASQIVKDAAESPASAEAYTLIGAIYSSLDRRTEAIKAFKEVLRREAKPLVAMLALADLNFSNYALDEAKAHIEQALGLAPKNPAARVLLVRILLAQNDLVAARHELATLHKEFPNMPAVLTLVAAQELAAGRIASARAAYTRASQLSPDDLAPLTGLVQIDLASGRPNDALNRVVERLKQAKPTSELLTLAGHVHSMAGDLDRAEEFLLRAIEAEPERLRAYALLGAVYVRQKRLDSAVSQFRAITDRSPDSVAAHTMLGMLYEVQRRPADAERHYERALSIDPDAPVAANNLAWMYVAGNRDLSAAFKLAQRAHRKLPDDPQVNDTLGWIYQKQNEPWMAVRHLTTSLDKDPTNPAVHYHLGMAYLRAQDMTKARQSLQRALAMKREFDGIAEARIALAGLDR